MEDDDIAQQVIRGYQLPVRTNIKEKTKFIKIDRDDTSTWGNERWPSGQSVGFLGHDIPITKVAWNNRLNENLYDVFSTLMKTKELWVSVDRYITFLEFSKKNLVFSEFSNFFSQLWNYETNKKCSNWSNGFKQI